ncbi:hypothetical protein V8F20_007150 [Naviculisporaceae sp. PSN 640]
MEATLLLWFDDLLSGPLFAFAAGILRAGDSQLEHGHACDTVDEVKRPSPWKGGRARGFVSQIVITVDHPHKSKGCVEETTGQDGSLSVTDGNPMSFLSQLPTGNIY